MTSLESNETRTKYTSGILQGCIGDTATSIWMSQKESDSFKDMLHVQRRKKATRRELDTVFGTKNYYPSGKMKQLIYENSYNLLGYLYIHWVINTSIKKRKMKTSKTRNDTK